VHSIFSKCVLTRYRITVDLDVTAVLIRTYTKPLLMSKQILAFERTMKSLFIQFQLTQCMLIHITRLSQN